ncbi:IS200/IS605 family transposase [Nonomuraea sp. NPDC048901]|uniref:IS200/IS605 family transposase n=1 Tax=Nonomuraea sp. NPDC048901 TaxID=3155627 RepID=UPI0033F23AF5
MSLRWNANPDVKRGRLVVYNLHAHLAFVANLVFATKDRRGVLTGEMLIRCEELMREVCADFEVERSNCASSTASTTTSTCSSTTPPKVALSKLVNWLKGVSARMRRKEYSTHVRKHLWGGHFWSGSYFAGSVGGAPLAALKQYIEQQKQPACVKVKLPTNLKGQGTLAPWRALPHEPSPPA